MTIWTERLDDLKGYLSLGLSYRVIADKFGTSRGAISGVVDRYGLAEKDKPRHPSVSKLATTSAGRKRKQRISAAPIEFVPTPEPTEATDIVVEFVPENPIRLVDATKKHCKWPIGEPTSDMLVCGEIKVAGGWERPYCGFHSRIAYQPSRSAPRQPLIAGRGRG